MRPRFLPMASLLALLGCGCQGGERGSVNGSPDPEPEAIPAVSDSTPALELATLGAGCYWCIEAVLEQIDGVEEVRSGFTGGELPNPSYRDICTGLTGHAEVVQVHFDPEVLSYTALLDWFWRLHDPTTLNAQGADVGTQYRSAIFYHGPAQRQQAEESLAAATSSFKSPIVTEITEAGEFFPADDYHQDYYRANRTQRYCQIVIRPKLRKLGLQD
ncbi:MAG: peptide-methionine (S)-S-oxide reductase MsrA [bacterium]